MTAMPRSVQDAARSRRLRLAGGNTVQVYILLSEVTTQTIGQLTAAGVTVEIANAGERRVQARVPVRSLRRIAGLPFVRFVRLPSYADPACGCRRERRRRHPRRSNTARPQFGVDGTGVRVGVISDGINGVFATKCTSCDGVSGGPIGSDDLPEATGTREDGVLTGSTGGLVAQSFRSDADLEDRHSFFQPCAFRGAGAEGGALLEIVHDLAPGAQLSFGNADTSLSFIEAVNALAADNDVVVDDLGFLGEPADGQSSVSRNTAAALNNPANRIRTYVTSVGNAANDHYFGPYVASGVDGRSINGITAPGRLHLFQRTGDTTDVLNLGDRPHDLISLPTNGEVVVVMTWNDPAGQSANNYDLYLVDDDTGEVVARSTDVQRGVQDALEAIDFLNRGEAGFFRIVVQNVNDEAAPRNLNMFAFQPQCAVDGPRRLADGASRAPQLQHADTQRAGAKRLGRLAGVGDFRGRDLFGFALGRRGLRGQRRAQRVVPRHQPLHDPVLQQPRSDARRPHETGRFGDRRRGDHRRGTISESVLRYVGGGAARGRHRGAGPPCRAVPVERWLVRDRGRANGGSGDVAHDRGPPRRKRAEYDVRLRTGERVSRD